MVQFLSINFFSWISSIFVGFFKSSRFLCHPVLLLRFAHWASDWVLNERERESERQRAFQESSYFLLNRIYKISTMTTVNTGSRSFNWRAGKPPGRMDKDVLLLIDGITCSLIESWFEHLGFIHEVLRLQLILNLVVLKTRSYKLPRATVSPPRFMWLGWYRSTIHREDF